MIAFDVQYGRKIANEMQYFPSKDLIKIKKFENHIKQYGFDGLEGRNKSSDNVPTDDPQWQAKVRYAQQHNLWHYHIGIPCYENSDQGDKVSEYVLHYIKGDNFIKIVDMNGHPPFNLPRQEYLQ